MSDRVMITTVLSLVAVICAWFYTEYRIEKLRLQPSDSSAEAVTDVQEPTHDGQVKTPELEIADQGLRVWRNLPGSPNITVPGPNLKCEHFDRELGRVVDKVTDFDLDPETNTRVQIVKCEGYDKPLMTHLSNLEDGVPASDLVPAPVMDD